MVWMMAVYELAAGSDAVGFSVPLLTSLGVSRRLSSHADIMDNVRPCGNKKMIVKMIANDAVIQGFARTHARAL